MTSCTRRFENLLESLSSRPSKQFLSIRSRLPIAAAAFPYWRRMHSIAPDAEAKPLYRSNTEYLIPIKRRSPSSSLSLSLGWRPNRKCSPIRKESVSPSTYPLPRAGAVARARAAARSRGLSQVQNSRERRARAGDEDEEIKSRVA